MAGFDSAIIDSVDRLEDRVMGGSRHVRQVLEAVQERMVALPNMPVSTLDKGLEIIQRKDYFFKMEVVKRTLTAMDNLQLARSSSQAALTNHGRIEKKRKKLGIQAVIYRILLV
jgi:hypothetical protein